MKPNHSQLLILDLDETLIHSSYSPIPNNDFCFQYKYFYVYQRPFLRDFLIAVQSKFDIAIWSASKADYVKKILRFTALSEFQFQFVFTRKNCKRVYTKNGGVRYLKDTSQYSEINCYDNVIFIDDLPEVIFPIERSLMITEYRGSKSDNQLKELVNVLSN